MAWLRLLCLVSGWVAVVISSEEESHCFPPQGISDLGQTSNKLNIYRQLKTSCNGQLKGWKFFAVNTGTFYVSTWRRYDDIWYLRSKTRINVDKTGEHEVLLPTYQRTRVRIGDAVGVSYLHKDDSAIIPHTTHLTTEEGLQTVTRFDFWGAEIPDTVADAHDVDARPAIEPIWNEETTRLVGGDDDTFGRAQFFQNGAYGVICDPEPDVSTWPQLFCRELGFDDAIEALPAIDVELVGIGNDEVGLHAPHCGADATAMDQCTASSNQCSKEQSVYVRCAYRTTLHIPEGALNRAATNHGMPMYLGDDGSYGPLCFVDDAAYADNVCWQLGYEHAKDFRAHTINDDIPGSNVWERTSDICSGKHNAVLGDCLTSRAKSACTKGLIVKCSHSVRLVGGMYDNEGRAEYYDAERGEWGSICDAEYTVDNWPHIFCRELGYQTAAEAYDAAYAYSGVGNGAITLRNPQCQQYTAMTMDRCWTRKEDFCDHSNDIYVVCDTSTPCDADPCKHGGTCVPAHLDYQCLCPPGYTGYDCEENIDDCANNPCQNGGQCRDGINSHTCNCPPYFGGDNCQHVDLPFGTPGYLMSVHEPGSGITEHVNEDTRTALNDVTLTQEYTTVTFSNSCPYSHVGGAIMLDLAEHSGMGYGYDNSRIVAAPTQQGSLHSMGDFCLGIKPVGDYFQIYMVDRPDKWLQVDENGHLVFGARPSDDSGSFYFIDVQSTESVILYGLDNFQVNDLLLTVHHDVSDLSTYEYRHRTHSLIITGHSSWQFFKSEDYNGEMITLFPGAYNTEFLQQSGFYGEITSLRPVGAYDSLILFREPSYTGSHLSLRFNQRDLGVHHFSGEAVQSFIVSGPASWELFAEADFSGRSKVVAPGKYNMDWIRQNIGNITSCRKEDRFTQFCGNPGRHSVQGYSGRSHDVDLVERQGGMWIVMGHGNMSHQWNHILDYEQSIEMDIFNRNDLKILRDYNILEWVVDSDVNFLFQAVHNSWHPSAVEVMYLGSRQKGEMRFTTNPNLDTHVSFTADHLHVRCGSAYSTNLCGDSSTNFPATNQISDPLVVTKLTMQPQGLNAYADGEWFRNAYTWSGSKYLLMAKLTSCLVIDDELQIPAYMEHDIWTRSTTGCPCLYNTNSTDCACCHEGGCQCPENERYQCVRCGFTESHCGLPSVSEAGGTYTLEETDIGVGNEGDHFQLPETCVTSCIMTVDARAATSTDVVANLADWSSRSRLSCRIDTQLSDDPNAQVQAYSSPTTGVPISSIHLYGFEGQASITRLQLVTSTTSCAAYHDHRYVGCFHAPTSSDQSVMQSSSMTSDHLTVEMCIAHCHTNNYLFAGLSRGTKCVCGMLLPGEGTTHDCLFTCSGSNQETCGGQTSLTIYKTEGSLSGGYFMGHGSCAQYSVATVLSGTHHMDAEQCNTLTGTQYPAGTMVDCTIELCHSPRLITDGLYPARPGTCGSNYVTDFQVYTLGSDCANMGGDPDYDEDSWGVCALDLCHAQQNIEVLVANVRGSCDVEAWRGYAGFMAFGTAHQCQALGGVLGPDAGSQAMVTCYFDFCAFTGVDEENIYDFPNHDMVVDGELTVSIDVQCAASVEFYIETPATYAQLEVQASFEGHEVGLYITASGNGGGAVATTVSYASPATGVQVDSLRFRATNDTAVVRWLRITQSPEGCQAVEDAIILYDLGDLMGEPRVIHEDSVADLTDFNNRVNSIKVVGSSQWQVFEYRNFEGSSVVLKEGEYYDMSITPFGNNAMSSVRKVTSANMPRSDISDSDGVVCFQTVEDVSYVFGTILSPHYENRPKIFYFGQYGGYAFLCEQACRAEPECVAWTQHLDNYADSGLAGGCYGRGISGDSDIEVVDDDVVSGKVSNCALEDTITVFEEDLFQGGYRTIIENAVNLTIDYSSVIITGNDYWRLTFHTETEIHNFWLSAGKYGDLDQLSNGTLVEIVKQHPGTLFYGNSSVDMSILYPIIESEVITETGPVIRREVCNTTHRAEISFVVDCSNSIKSSNFELVRQFIQEIVDSFDISPTTVRVGTVLYSSAYFVQVYFRLGDHTTDADLSQAIHNMPYLRGATYTHLGLELMRTDVLSKEQCRDDIAKVAIVFTDGRSAEPESTKEAAAAARADGINLISVGVKNADYNELVAIAGDQSRVYTIDDFDKLAELAPNIKETTCRIVEEGGEIRNRTVYHAITIPGDDRQYFEEDHWEFHRKPHPLGMESGVILNAQIFAHSSLILYPAWHARLRWVGGWISAREEQGSWIQSDFGKILPVHGVSTQGHSVVISWVKAYKIAISIDGINFETLKDRNSSMDIIFEGNTDQETIKYHCLHRIFGVPIKARVVRIIVVAWHIKIGLRYELYGYRDYDDSQVKEALKKDVWTRNITGCPCYFNAADKSCACCEDGGCQCSSSNRHQCVQCGYPHNCGTPSIRNMRTNVDGWTRSMSGCRCLFNPLRMDCACCQSFGCQCGSLNKNQCVNCGHPEHCGLKEWLFGQNEYCYPKTCPPSNQNQNNEGMADE